MIEISRKYKDYLKNYPPDSIEAIENELEVLLA